MTFFIGCIVSGALAFSILPAHAGPSQQAQLVQGQELSNRGEFGQAVQVLEPLVHNESGAFRERPSNSRRTMNKSSRRFYEFGPFRMDPGRKLLLHDRNPVALTSKAFEMLLVLVEHSEEKLRHRNLIPRSRSGLENLETGH